MRVEYYGFALFIAALICLIAVLFKLLFANARRQNKELDEREEKILQFYQTVENIIEEFNDQAKTVMDDIKDYEQRAAAHVAVMTRPPPLPTPAPPSPPQTAAATPTPTVAAPAPVAAPPPMPPSPPPVPKKREAELISQTEGRSGTKSIDPSRLKAASEAVERAEKLLNSGTVKSSVSTPGVGSGVVIQRLFDDPADEQPSTASEKQTKSTKREAILELAKEGKTEVAIARELGITQNEVKLVVGFLAGRSSTT